MDIAGETEYLPIGHSVHCEDPGLPENVPDVQEVQAVASVWLAYSPASQTWQLAAEDVAEY